MQSPEDCHHELLAKNHAAVIQRCRHCGSISLHVGPFSLRLSEAGLEALWEVMGEALTVLRRREERRSRSLS